MTEALSKQRWVIVMLACFWVSWFDFGLQTVTGAFFDAMLEYYGSDRTTTASVAGLFTAVNQGFGFVVGLLVQRFGITKISFVGAILIPLGFILNVFALSVIHVLVCFGVITALGVAMMYVCSVAMIRKVCSGPFKGWFPLSLTIHSSCISFAGFSLPYLIHFLNKTFALPGTFLLFGGILGNNVCVFILFYFISKQIDSDSESPHEGQEDTKTKAIETVEIIESPPMTITHSSELAFDNYAYETQEISTVSHKSTKTYEAQKHLEMESGKHIISADSNMKQRKHEDDICVGTCTIKDKHVSEIFVSELSGVNVLDKNEKLDEKQNYESSNNAVLSKNANNNFDIFRKTQNDTVHTTFQKSIQQRFICGVTHAREMMFGHVNIIFTCVFLCVSLVIGIQNSYVTIIIDMLGSKGFPQDMAIHAYIPLHVCALICRVLPGIITAIDPIWFVVFYSFCGTAGQFILSISSDYTVCMVGVGLTGMTMGGVISAATLVVANSIDHDKFALAFGQILTGVGIIATAMTPVYGALRDTWGNYDIVLTTTGIIQSLGALLCIIGWIVNRKYNVK